MCTKEEQRSVIRFYEVGRCIRGRNTSKTFGTKTVYCRNGVSTNGLKNLKNGRTNVTHDKGADDSLRPPLRTTLGAHVTWFVRQMRTIDEVPHVLQIRGRRFTSDQEVKEAVHA